MAGQNNWEFLLQQEGDRSWLPLESPDVEILEGRYRILIRTAASNTKIGIQITHEATEELPPKRRTQTRSGRTSADGLMVIIPFTLLHPGIWEMSCTPNDLTNDLLGYAGHYSIQLHVLPKESDLAGEWEPDWSQSASEESATETSNAIAQDTVQPIAVQPSPDPIAPLDLIKAPIADPIADSIADPIPDRNLPLTLSLTAQTYDIQPGQTLILSGSLISSEPSLLPIELKTCTFTTTVRDPQSGDPIVTTAITFTTLLLPYDFQIGVVLPTTLTGQLFLGEIILTQGAEDLPRATQSFTLLADLDRLLSALPETLKSTTRPSVTDDLPVPPADPAGPEFNDAFLGMINQTTAPREFRPPSSQLPPKLYQPDRDRSDRPPLALPTFLRTPAPETDLNVAFNDETWHDPAEPSSPFDLPNEDWPNEDWLDEDLLEGGDRLEEDRLLSEVTALEGLPQNLDDALPQDLYNTTAPLDLNDPDDQKTIDITAERLSLSPSEPPPELSLNPFATRRPLPTETVVLNDAPVFTTPYSLSESAPMTIPAADSIPTPRLEIEAVTEVIAGQSLAIKLKLPNLQPKLYVKLWINDRATRTLLDGPRYLIDFLPSTEPDTLEATTTLTVPLGSLEIQIEAITIETATQRESYKASAPLSVIPPNLPEFSLDDIKF